MNFLKSLLQKRLYAILLCLCFVLLLFFFAALGAENDLAVSAAGAELSESSSAAQQEELPAPAEEAVLPEEDFSLHLGAELMVEAILQYPEFPNGCEATSLAIVLQYLWFDVDKETIAYEYLENDPFTWEDGYLYAPNPEIAYAGNPASSLGFYCFEKPVANAANLFLADTQSTRRATSLYGASEEDLLNTLDKGFPVIVWKSIDNKPPYTSSNFSWYLRGTETVYIPYTNLHVLVLRGYTETEFLLSDPLGREETIERELFMELFTAFGGRAVYIGNA
ncbi:MAG: C39 family peptidase [Oscillospiraceae bacterium]